MHLGDLVKISVSCAEEVRSSAHRVILGRMIQRRRSTFEFWDVRLKVGNQLAVRQMVEKVRNVAQDYH